MDEHQQAQLNPRVREYLDTFRRIPDDVVRKVAPREVDPENWRSCLCAWVSREHFAALVGQTVDTTFESWSSLVNGEMILDGVDKLYSPADYCVAKFGGEERDWSNIYYGITDYRQPFVLEAWELRLREVGCDDPIKFEPGVVLVGSDSDGDFDFDDEDI